MFNTKCLKKFRATISYITVVTVYKLYNCKPLKLTDKKNDTQRSNDLQNRKEKHQ